MGINNTTLTPPAEPAAGNYKKAHNELGQYGFVVGGTSHNLPVPPQEMTVDEPAATSITATLGGGKWVERRGMLFKQLSLIGTFGFYPKDGSRAEGDADNASAFAQMHSLRKFFRDYQNHFQSGGSHESYQMVWVNPRDTEHLVVELVSFRLTRPKAFVYRYQIDLRVLGYYNGARTSTAGSTPATGRRTTATEEAKVFVTVTRLPYTAVIPPAKIAADKAAPAPAAPAAADPKRSLPLPPNMALGYLKKINGFYNYIRELQGTGSLWTSAAVGFLNDNLSVVYGGIGALSSVANQALGLATSALEVADLAIGTIRAGADAVLRGQSSVAQIVNQANMLGSRFDDGLAAWQLALGINTTPDSTASTTAEATAARSEALSNITGYEQHRVLPGETLPQFAARVVGSTEAAGVLAAVNGLQPPFFSSPDEQLPNTVPYGGVIRVPVFNGSQSSNLVVGAAQQRPETVVLYVDSYDAATATVTVQGFHSWRPNRWAGYIVTGQSGEHRPILSSAGEVLVLSAPFAVPLEYGEQLTLRSVPEKAQTKKTALQQAQQAFGRDLLLVPSPGGGMDLAVGPTGDLALVEGLPNLQQAVMIKMRTRYGDLPMHTSGVDAFGVTPVVGRPVDANAVFALESGIRFSLLSDPRISKVENLVVQASGTAVTASLDITPIGDTLPQSFSQVVL